MKLKNLVENFDLARYALQSYPHDPHTLDSMLPRFRISSNAVYPYLHEGQLRFLRMAPLEEKSLALVCAEIEFIQHLRAHGYPAMKPIANCRNELAFLLDSPWGTYCVSSFERVPGIPLEDAPVTPALIHTYGRTLGQLHAISAACTARILRPAWDEALPRQELLHTGTSDDILAAYDRVFAELRALPVDPEVYGLIHYDFEPDNVFWDKNSQRISVIDFDDCIYSWYAMDIAQALDCLGDLCEQDLSADFLAGYQSAFPFSKEQEAQLPLMRRYINLRSYARLKHCLSEGVDSPPDWMISLRKLLENKLASLEAAITR